jgi:hypothetical protein
MKKTISYSQLNMYNDCQFKWYLTYVKKVGSGESNIHTTFGSGMHSVLQNYLETLYNQSASAADALDLYQMLHDELSKEFLEASKSAGKHVATKEELVEFYMDGVAILEFFKKHRSEYFSKKGFELVGIEIPLKIDTPRNTTFLGYIDIAIRDAISGKVKIIDFKTSTMGWRDYQKNDASKTSQIILYKKFYADKFNISVDKIDVEFIILKRKLYENVDFPQKRIQRFSPASGKTSMNATMQKLNEFINTCFTEDGIYNEERKYPKVADQKKCKYCEFFNNKSLCGGPKN